MSNENIYNISVPTITYVNKTYNVVREKIINKIYLGDVSGIALWFYQTQNIHVDNIKIIIYGDFHNTFPNPQHLTVEITYPGYRSGRLHMSIDEYGNWYQQPLQHLTYMGGKKLKHKSKKYKAKICKAKICKANTRKLKFKN